MAVLVLAALGKFSLWAAVAVDVGTALLVIANGMTLLRWQGAREACGTKSGCRRTALNKSGSGCCSDSGCGSQGEKNFKMGCLDCQQCTYSFAVTPKIGECEEVGMWSGTAMCSAFGDREDKTTKFVQNQSAA